MSMNSTISIEVVRLLGIEFLLYAKHYGRSFTSTLWPDFHNRPMKQILLLSPLTDKETKAQQDFVTCCKSCTPMFIAALFIIARTWKQPRCPSADKWIRKLWYIYTMDYYSAIKKNSFESVLMRWVKLEPIIQSEVSQKDKYQYSILTHIYGI